MFVHDSSMITWKEFADILRIKGEYRTPEKPERSVADKLFGRFDWRYHSIISSQVWQCGRLATGGLLTDENWAEKCFGVLKAVERCGSRVEVIVAPESRNKSPRVYVANHMSVLETMVLPCILIPFGHPTMVAKESLLRYPSIGHILRASNCISVTRENPREDLRTVLSKGKESLLAGNSVAIFPQATRNPIFDRKIFNSLGVKLASRSGVPVVPLALKTDFSGIGMVIKEFGKIDRSKPVHFEMGSPIDASSGEKKAHEATVDFIADRVCKWGGQVI